MKKLLTLAAIFIASLTIANAQTEKGNQTLGIDASFFHQNENLHTFEPGNGYLPQTSKYTSFSIGPNYSYFISNNLDLGANLNYTSTSTNNSYVAYNLIKQDNKSFSATVFLRKYFLYNNKIGLRVGPYLTYGHTTQSYTYAEGSNDSAKGNDFYVSGKLDFVYFPSKRLGLAATIVNLSYEHFKNNDTAQGNSSGNNFGLNLINSNLNFSIFYVFGSKG